MESHYQPWMKVYKRRGEWTVEQGQNVMVKNQVIQSKKWEKPSDGHDLPRLNEHGIRSEWTVKQRRTVKGQK